MRRRPGELLGVRTALLACLLLARVSAFDLGLRLRSRVARAQCSRHLPERARVSVHAVDAADDAGGARGRPDIEECLRPSALADISAYGAYDDDSAQYDPTAANSPTATLAKDDKDQSIEEILRQLESIQQGNPKKIVILGTRHCSFLHQQIIELLSYALVLSGNHVYTSGAIGTHTAVIRGALRAENQELLTVILPQTIDRQPQETRTLLESVEQVLELGHNELPLGYASRLCNSELLAMAEQLIVFAFHDSNTLKEAIQEGKARGMLVTVMWLD